MTSRRTRLKAVINLPVRRGRECDQSSASSEKVDQDVSSQSRVLIKKISEDVTEVTVHSKQCDTPTASVGDNTPVEQDVDVGATVDRGQIEKLNEQKSTKEKDADLILGCSISLPPKMTVPIRKRLKPFVSLSALSRKPKETELNENDNNKDVDTSSSVPQKNNQHDSILRRISNIQHVKTEGEIAKETIFPICTSNISEPSASACNLKLSSKSHLDVVALSKTLENLQPPTKVISKSKHKLTPRLVDASTRRNSQNYLSEAEDPLKILPTVSQKNCDPIATKASSNEPTFSESDEEVEGSSLFSYPLKKTQPVSKNPTHLASFSVTSIVHEDTLELEDIQSSKSEKRPQTHRRPRKSGMGEMLSMARRDFYKKFGTSTPDKKKLTMFDLIFYNPSSNPMKPVDKNKCIEKKLCIESKQEDAISERIAEESVDDVGTPEDGENISIPAPQVKVGPDGSLIIDEKSLVIETTGSKKRKDELANSSLVVDYGLGSATYNSFSKKVKPREWSKEETLKFYRALQSVGTDFLLMQSIFPNRTRGDLKQKYKKEDRLNRDLIDKALRNPLEFDLTELEKELEQEEKENEEREQRQIAEKKRLAAKKEKKTSTKGMSYVVGAVLETSSKAGGTHKSNSRKRKNNLPPNGIPLTSSKARRTSNARSHGSSTSEDEDDVNCEVYFDNIYENGNKVIGKKTKSGDTGSGDEESEKLFLLKAPQPTRYGRIPRTRKLSEEVTVVEQQNHNEISEGNEVLPEYSPMCADDEGIAVPNHNIQQSLNIANLHNVEPGSLVILSTPGQKTLQLFMVAPRSQNNSLTHIPVAITPEILASVSSSIGGLGTQESTSSL